MALRRLSSGSPSPNGSYRAHRVAERDVKQKNPDTHKRDNREKKEVVEKHPPRCHRIERSVGSVTLRTLFRHS